MFTDFLSASVRPSMVVFKADATPSVNEYGERVFNASVITSGWAWADKGTVKQQRKPDGTFPVEVRWVLFDEWLETACESTWIELDGFSYKVEEMWGGGNITGRTVIKAVRLLG